MERRILESAEMGREAARREACARRGRRSARDAAGATAARGRVRRPGVMPGARAEAVARAGAADAATPRAAIIAGVITDHPERSRDGAAGVHAADRRR